MDKPLTTATEAMRDIDNALSENSDAMFKAAVDRLFYTDDPYTPPTPTWTRWGSVWAHHLRTPPTQEPT